MAFTSSRLYRIFTGDISRAAAFGCLAIAFVIFFAFLLVAALVFESDDNPPRGWDPTRFTVSDLGSPYTPSHGWFTAAMCVLPIVIAPTCLHAVRQVHQTGPGTHRHWPSRSLLALLAFIAAAVSAVFVGCFSTHEFSFTHGFFASTLFFLLFLFITLLVLPAVVWQRTDPAERSARAPVHYWVAATVWLILFLTTVTIVVAAAQLDDEMAPGIALGLWELIFMGMWLISLVVVILALPQHQPGTAIRPDSN
jgi:hypothetical protein